MLLLGQYLVALALHPNHAIDSIEAFSASLYLPILLLSVIKDAVMQYKKPNEGGLQLSLSQLSDAEVSLLFGMLWGPLSINCLARNRSAALAGPEDHPGDS